MQQRTAEGPELRRLREDLYRPSPPAGAVERYTALLERTAPAAAATRDDPPARSARRRRRALAPAALGLAALVAVGAAATASAAVDRAEQPRDLAQPLVTGGPYAVADRDAISRLATPGRTDVRLVVRAVQGSDLPQLDVWDGRRPIAWLQQGSGPFARRYAPAREASTAARPLSIVVQCAGTGRYRWTLRGSTPERPAVHVLATATARCGPTPTVATVQRARGAEVRGFDLAIGDDVRWGMALVVALDE
ncbi:hypothetical protein [Amnibacterium endophyticum]|uniref:Uncharacterized protein n=1 Tax=Amnibacterium endophyticum TaxID=2109337 RepID=A0ABW4LBB9_9MICO